ncbi:MAG: hypothetical protein V4717_12985 [Bacteroidota bacterium]
MRNILVCSLLFISQLSWSQTKSKLTGWYIAPVGVKVTIQKDSLTDLLLDAKPNGSDNITRTPFAFAESFVNGLPYTLKLKSVPPGITAIIYKGIRGTTGVSPDFIRVGADYTYELQSRSTDNKTFGTFYDSQSPAIGGDFAEEGRYVAFLSSAANLDGSTGKKRQIFYRDRKTGATTLISKSQSGEEANGDCMAPVIAGDGKSVAFESYATNLANDDNNSVRDVYVWTAAKGVQRVSALAGAGANGESYEPAISGNGNLIAFSSGASNLTEGVNGNSTINVFIRDMNAGTVKLVSADRLTGAGVGGSAASISDDGTRLAFCSMSASLTENDNNGLWDIFVYDHANPVLKRISVAPGGTERVQGNESASRVVYPAISGNGAYVAYATTAGNLVPGDNNNAQDVFLCEIATGQTARVSVDAAGKEGNGDSPAGQGERVAISMDGSMLAFTTAATNLGTSAGNILLYDLVNKKIRPVTKDGYAGRPVISRNGGYVFFGIGARLDGRYSSSGLFTYYTGLTPCFSCNN